MKVKYTAGVQGFVPETSEVSGQAQTSSWQSQNVKTAQAQSWQSHHEHSVKLAQQQHQQQQTKTFQAPRVQTPARTFDDSTVNSDASYKISYNTGEHAREEKSDAAGNVQGRYSYVDEAGEHDLTYIAGPKTGFVVTGGSLSVPGSSVTPKTSGHQSVNRNFNAAKSWSSADASKVSSVQKPEDGSYAFSYTADDHARSESSDAAGNVQGRYSYTDEAGQHDLSYVAGGETGFVVTGGSLSKPNGLAGKTVDRKPKVWSTPVPKEKVWSPPKESFWSQSDVKAAVASNDLINHEATNLDGSAYSFFYNADSHSRQEESDAAGNVRGSYAIRTGTGHEELEYEAGKDGFVVTGGSLAPKPPSWANSDENDAARFSFQQRFGSEQSQDFEEQQPFPERGFFPNGRPRPLQLPTDYRPYSMEKSVQPTFTIVAPATVQKSFEYGPKNAIVLGFLPPKHDEKHGYIYDTQK